MSERRIDTGIETLTYDHDNRARRGVAARVVDTIGRMQRAGRLSLEQAMAAQRFRSDFYRAGMSELRAADYARDIVSGKTGDGTGALAARAAVNRIKAAIGEPGFSCLWHVVGLEESVKLWGRQHGWSGTSYDEHTAAGILIAALGALAVYYETRGFAERNR